MPETNGSFFIVKRKADEDEVFGGKRLRLLGSYNTKPNEDDIVSHIGRRAFGKKRVIIQDFDTDEFKQFISELPEKKTKTDDEHSNLKTINVQSRSPQIPTSPTLPPRLGLNLNAAENVVNTPKKEVDVSDLPPDMDDRSDNSNRYFEYIYDVYRIGEEDCDLDFGTIHDPDKYIFGDDDDEDENNENWRGNDYPDDDDDSHKYSDDSVSSQNSYSHFGHNLDKETELYDFELDDFRKFAIHDTDDEFLNDSDSESDYH